MAQPNSLTDVTATVQENGTAATMNTVTVAVTFPDGSSTTYSLANGDVVAISTGVYRLTYTTKGPGEHRELWTFTTLDGSVGTFLNTTGVWY